MSSWMKADIDTIDGGSIKDKINFELCRALQNGMDPNCEWNKKRKVVATITLTPTSEHRNKFDVRAQVSFKPVPDKECVDSIAIDRDGTPMINSSFQIDLDRAILDGAVETMARKTGDKTE